MRKFLHILLCLCLIFAPLTLIGCARQERSIDYLRLHIRANSNSHEDQQVKYLVRDRVIEYLTPFVASVDSRDGLVNMLESKLDDIECVADEILINNGFNYTSHASINYEYFPTRVYDENLTLEANYYDALILGLGEAVGDNWWCVVYPPLCFVGDKVEDSRVRYKSKIVEWIREIFGE